MDNIAGLRAIYDDWYHSIVMSREGRRAGRGFAQIAADYLNRSAAGKLRGKNMPCNGLLTQHFAALRLPWCTALFRGFDRRSDLDDDRHSSRIRLLARPTWRATTRIGRGLFL